MRNPDGSGATEFDRGAFVMTVCNACRYCEQYCPVFPAMERRLTFAPSDLGVPVRAAP
jgi:citrate/tricarballylate utilization protein